MTKRSYKTVLLGDASVGKSSFAVRLTKGEFSDNTNSTIGAAFFTYTVHHDSLDNQKKSGSNDQNRSSESSQSSQPQLEGRKKRGEGISGYLNYQGSAEGSNPDQTNNSNLTNNYEENITIKFDIWDTAGQERFKSIAPIYYRGAACAIVILDISSPQTLQHAAFWVNQIRLANRNETIIVLVANKIDLLGSTPETLQTLANAKAYAKENSLTFVETSAKTGQNISYVFELLSQEICKDPFRWDKRNTSNPKLSTKSLKVDSNKLSDSKKLCCIMS